MKYGRSIGILFAVTVLATSPSVYAGPSDEDSNNKPKFTFALWGDTPYTADEVAKIPALTAEINDSKVAFSVFAGDIKSGSTLCTNDVFTLAIARFDAFKAPMVYVPGDNEWTDCHRKNNGGYNNLERLDYLRATMFATAESFGQEKMTLEHQGPLGGAYSENTRWTYGNVVFTGLNVPGSNNNKVNGADCFKKSVRTAADCAADNVEYLARDAANIAFLKGSFEMARATGALGVVVIFQADPSFDLPETETFPDGLPENERTCIRLPQGYCLETTDVTLAGYDGYNALVDALTAETMDYDGQVVLVHGDTHFYKVDKPLVDQAHLLSNFTRVQTFGSPNVDWIQVTVDPKSRNLFTFEPMVVGAGPNKKDGD
jgi:hypothetical protein